MTTVIQDVSEGSKLWKLVTGINQRQFARGQSGIRYGGTTVTGVDTFAESGVVTGSVMQSVAFWRALQITVSSLYNQAITGSFSGWLAPPENGTSFAGETELTPLLPDDIYPIRAFTAPGVQRVDVGTVRGTIIQAGDMIGEWLIDDLLTLLAPLRWHDLDFGEWVPRPIRLLSGNDGDPRRYQTCSEAYAAVSAGYRTEQSGNFAPVEYYLAGSMYDRIDGVDRYDFGWSYQHMPDPFEYADGLTGSDRTLHHVVQYSGNGYDYAPLGTAPVAPGFYTVKTGSVGITIAPADAGFAWDGTTIPLVLHGVNCSTLNVRRGYRTDHRIIVQGHYVDLQ